MTNDKRHAEDWQRQQMEIDDPGVDDVPAGTAIPGRGEPAADWNKGQMEFDDGGEAQPRIDPDAMPGSESGPTGQRANPGGGQRFGHVDHADDEEGDRG